MVSPHPTEVVALNLLFPAFCSGRATAVSGLASITPSPFVTAFLAATLHVDVIALKDKCGMDESRHAAVGALPKWHGGSGRILPQAEP